MGIYLNPGNTLFEEAVRSKIYVDKTGLISYTNEVLGTMQKYICISRPRRFGKSMAANMLVAYYGKECDSKEIFQGLNITKDTSFKTYLNKYNVLFFNIQNFLSHAKDVEQLIEHLQEEVLKELKQAFSDYIEPDEKILSVALEKLYSTAKTRFIFIIDEWDCIFREKKNSYGAQTKYLDFLRDLLKDKAYVALAYMTGILPIKKYGSHSALNMFNEYSMTEPEPLEEYVGFTETEAKKLYKDNHMDFEEAKRWYDGYLLNQNLHVYNPKSVVDSILRKKIASYWTWTETYESLRNHINLNFDGLKDAIIQMLAGGTCTVNSRKFQNDMTSFESKDDILTLLIHLGYLAYDSRKKQVYIPNEEIREEFKDAIEGNGWNTVVKAIEASEQLLHATWEMNGNQVAEAINEVHQENTSILTYNNENALSCVISLAYYNAMNEYTLIRELPAGKGFADIVFLPRKHSNKPAMVVELKYDKSASGAIEQIKEKQYVEALKEYQGNLLLIGINYDKDTKKHECVIEQYKII